MNDTSTLMAEMRLGRSVPVALTKDGSFIFGQVRVIQYEGLVCERLDAKPGEQRYLELSWVEAGELYELMDSPEFDNDNRKGRLEVHLRSPKPRPYLRAVDKTCDQCGGYVDFKGKTRKSSLEEFDNAEVEIEVREDPSVPPGHVVWLVPPGGR